MKFDYKALFRWLSFAVLLVGVYYLTNILTYEVQRGIITFLLVLMGIGMANTVIDSVFGFNIYLKIKGKVLEQWNKKPKVYASVSGNDFLLYRWPEIEILGKKYSDIEFYLYGNTAPWRTKNKNVIIRGRVSQDVMNDEIQDMQGGLRLLPFEGFSEIVAKGILWGQYPISAIKYPHTLSISEIGKLKNKKEPNFAGRKYYFNMLNKYPWSQK